MKKLLLLLCLSPFFCIAQRSNNFLLGTLQLDLPKGNTGVGARLAGGVDVNHQFLVGLGAGITKLEDYKKIYAPLFMHLSIGNFSKKVAPYAAIEPGYGIYNNTIRAGRNYVGTKGGFTFYGGLGLSFLGRGRSVTALSVGYNNYGFNTNGYKSSIESVSVRVSVIGL